MGAKVRSEEEIIFGMEQSTDVVKAYSRIPYNLLNQEIEGPSQDVLAELTKICGYYKIYKQGANFIHEGSNGDYVPSSLKYKIASSLINKESRFLFAETPDITINPKGDVGTVSEEDKENITQIQSYIDSVLESNMFEDALIKAAKDCFIGKRVACLINFNPEDGVSVTFLPSTQFVYETNLNNKMEITKFVGFQVIKESSNNRLKRIFRKRYTLENGEVYLEETIFDGAGSVVEELTSKTKILLTKIPVVVILNDGLTGEDLGCSEIEELMYGETGYSKLANADIDSLRKNMNPTKYTVDMSGQSTKNLKTGPGAYWDLGTDQNLETPHPEVGILENTMNYSEPLDRTLARIKTTEYEQVDMPNITEVQAKLSSGKALKAIYWPLVVRCKEKMKTWGPALRRMVEILIEGGNVYPECITDYIIGPLPVVSYEVKVVQNLPLPEDEQEEKTIDMAEVTSMVMSKKSYMKKWRGLTDEEVDEELNQIAKERQILEESSFEGMTGPTSETGTEEDIDDKGSYQFEE